MRIPIEWLAEYVDLKGVSNERLSEALNLSGTENEIIKSSADYPNIVVGEILEIEKHPNADKLQVAKVQISKEPKTKDKRLDGKSLSIVCGAPNIEVGQKVPVALVGAKIGEFEIKEAELRGVKSQGMLCSESELGISDDHSGIMILDARAQVGTPLASELSNEGSVLEAELTPNRSDCFSIIGIAREAAASLRKKLKKSDFEKITPNSKTKVAVEVTSGEDCPRYIAKVVEGGRVSPSPKWLTDRLAAAGVRSINNVVDVTNYVMLEWGQPMHAFDYDKLQATGTKQQEKKIVVRRAKKGEKIITLDSVSRSLTTEDLVIADTEKVIGLAGVMGGANSEVDEGTRTIVLEAAVFNRTGVRKSAQRQGIRTEASNRFEKGVPLALPEIAIERAAQLIAKLSETSDPRPENSELIQVGPNVDVLSSWIWVQHIGLRKSRIKEFLGVEIPAEKVIAILRSLGFEAEEFSFKTEARKHVGKPYVFGARFKTHGSMAFDCSYLSDYIYSLIGEFVGYTSLAQYKLGQRVEDDLKPGDILFVKGHIDKSATDHYFKPDKKGGYEKVTLSEPELVGHNALYIGNGRIIHARHYEYDFKTGKWVKNGKEGKVIEEDVTAFTENPEYIGASRFVADPDDYIAVNVPWWRLDVQIEEDLLEEIGRIYGYENFPATLPKEELPIFEENKKVRFLDALKDILVGVGFSEVVNYSFVSKEQLEKLGLDPKKALKIANPISFDQEYMRTSLLPLVINDLRLNQDNFSISRLFEVGMVYLPEGEELPREELRLAVAACLAGQTKAEAFYQLKGALEVAVERLNLGNIGFETSEAVSEAVARIIIGDKELGFAGYLSEMVKERFGIKQEAAVAEINLTELLEMFGNVKRFQSISKFPKSVRDLNFIFSKDIPAEAVLINASKSQVKLLEKVEIVDIYQGGNLPENKKSITIRLTFGSQEKTLQEGDIAPVLQGVIKSLENIGGSLRA